MKALGYFTAFIVTVIFSSIWSGYVLSLLWSWFMVPAFNLPQLSIPLAIGMAIIVRYMTDHIISDKDSRPASEILVLGIVYGFGRPLLALITGWIVRFYV